MKQDESSKNKSSNMVLKIGITYIIPIFLAVFGAVIISAYGWNYLFGRFFMPKGTFAEKNTSSQQVERATVVINGKTIYRPSLGEKIAILKIDSLDVDFNVFQTSVQGDTEKGIAHNVFSMLPGEGGNCVLEGYGAKGLSKLENINKNTEINLETSYGKYCYKVLSTDIINKDDEDSVIDYFGKGEKLTIVAGYPFNAIGEAPQSYVVTCEFIKVE